MTARSLRRTGGSEGQGRRDGLLPVPEGSRVFGPASYVLMWWASLIVIQIKAAELPLGRFGEPREVAETVAFLASERASLYVGQTLGPNSGDVML